jgi:hypothetical protein
MNETVGPGITIFAGRFGSGKTEVALNFALRLVTDPRGKSEISSLDANHSSEFDRPTIARPIVIDLDVVTPYFRSRETAEAMHDLGVDVIAPSIIGQHLDTPAITPEILGAIQQIDRPVVLDVGGDQQGARVLGQFRSAICQRGYIMHFVVNPFRPFTDTLDGLARSIAEIEASARLQISSLVSNPNLIGETKVELVAIGHAQVEAFARELGLPIDFVCIDRRWAAEFGANHFQQPVLLLDRFFVMFWE